MSSVDRRLLVAMKSSIPSMFLSYVIVCVLNVRIYFHFHRQVMELKECQAYGHISAPHHTSHGVPLATIESEGVYDNI